MSPEPNFISLASEAFKVKTVGDLWSLPFPLKAGELRHPERLESFYSVEGEPRMLTPLTADNKLSESHPLNEVHQMCANRLSSISHAWQAASVTAMSGRKFHGGPLHADAGAFGLTTPLLFHVTTHNSLLTTPHSDTLHIVRKYPSLEKVLSLDLTSLDGRANFINFIETLGFVVTHPRLLQQRGENDYIACHRELTEALAMTPPGHVICMTVATMHMQPTPVHPQRVLTQVAACMVG